MRALPSASLRRFVFQKSYVEFFCSPESWKQLLSYLPKHPSVSYHAMNFEGAEFLNCKEERPRVNAVTWGVFPGREIIQPTVVDTESFTAWKDEAFELWLAQWAAIYDGERDTEADAVARGLIKEVQAPRAALWDAHCAFCGS